MQTIQSVTGFIGKNTNNILEEKLGLTSPTHFNKIGFELYENIPADRAILLNNEPIYILPDQTLEIEDIVISSLKLNITTPEKNGIYMNITYSLPIE